MRTSTAAELAKGSLYKYFSSKRSLLEFIYARMIDPLFESLEQTVIIETLADFLPPQTADEIIDVVLGLEAHHIIGSKATHDRFMHGQRE